MMQTRRTELGPFEAVRELSYDAPFPRLLPVRQRIDAPQVEDVAAATLRRSSRCAAASGPA